MLCYFSKLAQYFQFHKCFILHERVVYDTVSVCLQQRVVITVHADSQSNLLGTVHATIIFCVYVGACRWW
jgi:hypothetical protein